MLFYTDIHVYETSCYVLINQYIYAIRPDNLSCICIINSNNYILSKYLVDCSVGGWRIYVTSSGYVIAVDTKFNFSWLFF